MKYKLGLKPSRTFKLALSDYIDLTKLPPIPDEVDWSPMVPGHYAGTMYANDRYGVCFFAAAAKALSTWTATSATAATFTDEDVLHAYSLATGFNPDNPATDQGTEPTAGFRFLYETGIKGMHFGPALAVSVTRKDLIMAACHLGGGLMVGVEFYEGWEDAPVWGVDNADYMVGGHEVWCPKASRKDGLWVETWGEATFRLIPWNSLAKYCDQLTVSLSPSFFNADLQAGNAFAYAELEKDLEAIT